MRPDRVAALVPVRIWDAEGEETYADLKLTLDDDDASDTPVVVDCRLVGGPEGADSWIVNVERSALERALAIVDAEREAVSSDG